MIAIFAETLAGPTEAIGIALLHFLWQGTLIALIYAVLRHRLRTLAPTWHVLLGQLAMLSFLLLPLLTAVLVAQTRQAATRTDLPQPDSMVATLAEAIAVPHASTGSTTLVWLVGLWLIGVLALSLRSALEWRRLRRICRAARPLPAPWLDVFENLVRGMGIRRRVRVCESPAVDTPMLFGWLSPVVLLPAGLVLRLPRDQVLPILMHELAHVRRLDFLFNLAEATVATLLYYHPAVHWLARRLAQDRELACDDLVLEAGVDRLNYARALTELAYEQHILHAPPPRPVLAATGGLLLDRIQRIIGSDRRPESEVPGRSSVRSAVVLGVALLVVASLLDGRNAYRPPLPDVRLGPVFAIEVPIRLLSLPIETRDRLAGPITMNTASSSRAAAMPSEPSAPMPSPTTAQAQTASPMATREVATPDAEAPATAAPATLGQAAQAIDSGPIALRREAPAYPREARIHGIEGSITLSFRVDERGRATNLRVEHARPLGVFERSARQALRNWRFATAADAGPTQRTALTFDFRLDSTDEPVECTVSLGSRICR